MRSFTPLVALVISIAAATAGCGGGSLGTVPRDAELPVRAPAPHAVVVRLHGRPRGTVRLRPTDGGQKTSVGLTLGPRDGAPLTAAVAHGRCAKPTALTSVSNLGAVHGTRTSWTVPTPFAQLRAAGFVVVLRSPTRAVAACGGPDGASG